MKTALITTTITVPYALEMMRHYDPDVRFFIAGDEKSPDDEILEFIERVDNAVYLPASIQKDMNYKCLELIGWNCIQRRNIALLEALKWGADIIITWDTDNLPTNDTYFDHFNWVLSSPFAGLQVSSPTRWYNQYPGFKHRGFPIDKHSGKAVSLVANAKIGVAAGMCLGDPDVDAYTRMALHPHIEQVGELESNGYVIAPGTRCVFNSQNTAFLRELAPAMFMAPGLGRGDDITASILVQRLMKDRGYQLHVGRPFTYQERHEHALMTDLRNELWTMENISDVAEFARKLNASAFIDVPLFDYVQTMCRYFWEGYNTFSDQTRGAALAFLDDVKKVM